MLVTSGDTRAMKRFAILLLIPVLGSCHAKGDPDAPRAGLWESRLQLLSLDGRKPDARQLALLFKGKPPVQQSCFDGAPGRTGEKRNRCEMIRFADAGSKVDRVWECKRPGKPGKVVSVFAGSRSADTYDYRITTTDRDPAGKVDGPVIKVRETARRIGDCPKP